MEGMAGFSDEAPYSDGVVYFGKELVGRFAFIFIHLLLGPFCSVYGLLTYQENGGKWPISACFNERLA
jgi:hypothetical protein